MPDSSIRFCDTGLVLAAGGSSRRFGAGNKLFADLAGMPVVLHSLKRLSPLVAQTVLVVPAEAIHDFAVLLQAHGCQDIQLVVGGSERQSSVLAGVKALREELTLVAVQDAARPLTTADLLARCVDSARRYGSGIAAHPVTDTIKVADQDGIVLDTPPRSTLWAAETPQCLRIDWLRQAYEHCLGNNIPVTDDAQAVQLLGHPTRLVPSKTPNLKITRPEDLELARLLLA